MKKYLDRLVQGNNLTRAEMISVMTSIMKQEISSVMTAGFLTALSAKKESIEEIGGAAEALLQMSNRIDIPFDTLDIVGTGGDKSYSFNISTVTAIVLSACGIRVCKHGNRSVSSKCGAADVLEALGVNITFPESLAKEILEKTGLVFLYAPTYHGLMKNVAPIRRELGFRTIFNILGPLINPMRPSHMLLGVYSKELCVPICRVLKAQGVKRAMVVYGLDGVDEISIAGKTFVAELKDKEIQEYEINPAEYGFSLAGHEELVGGNIERNKEILLAVLSGERGAKRDAVLINSAFALHIASDLPVCECINKVIFAIDSGKALQKLNELIEASHDIR